MQSHQYLARYAPEYARPPLPPPQKCRHLFRHHSVHRERNMQAVMPEILVVGHTTFSLIHFLTRHLLNIRIALILQIAQMARMFEISRRVQDPIEETVCVEEENRSPRVRRAEAGGEVGKADVPGGDGFCQ